MLGVLNTDEYVVACKGQHLGNSEEQRKCIPVRDSNPHNCSPLSLTERSVFIQLIAALLGKVRTCTSRLAHLVNI